MKAGLDEDSSDEDGKPSAEWVALPPFKDLYKSSPII